MKQESSYQVFEDFLDSYNQAFYDKDINKLKDFYDSTNNILLFSWKP